MNDVISKQQMQRWIFNIREHFEKNMPIKGNKPMEHGIKKGAFMVLDSCERFLNTLGENKSD